jgi:hypothetical protein
MDSQLRIEKQARDLINLLLAKGSGLKSEMIQSIEQDPMLESALRQEALEMIQRWQEDPRRLNNLSWTVVVGPNASAKDYDLALRRARAACSLEPNSGLYVNTLGAALISEWSISGDSRHTETLGRNQFCIQIGPATRRCRISGHDSFQAR